MHGPDWLHIDGENAEVRMTPLSPAPGQGQTVELTFRPAGSSSAGGTGGAAAYQG